MAERDAFSDLKRAKEEEYFHRKEKELIEKLRAKAQTTSESSGAPATDEGVLRELAELGFSSAHVELLHLVPLVQVAWASGKVEPKERAHIVEAARARGIAEGSDAFAQLNGWLETRPSDEFFADALRIVRVVLNALPESERSQAAADLLTLCRRVAEAAGGILGFGRVSADERAALDRVAAEIEQNHQDDARRLLDRT